MLAFRFPQARIFGSGHGPRRASPSAWKPQPDRPKRGGWATHAMLVRGVARARRVDQLAQGGGDYYLAIYIALFTFRTGKKCHTH
jgi:hypothetical protein